MGTKAFVMHEHDALEVQQLREQLRTLRLLRGASQAELERQLGLPREFFSSLERGANPSPLVSTLQSWGRALDVRVEFEVQDLWRFHHGDQEFAAAFRRSRPWGADEAARRFLVVGVRQWRIARQMDVEHLAPLMGQAGETIRGWESTSQDPLISRVMVQARASGTRVRMRTFTREEWFFG
jgi:transcriptional regulator with XRE-family HTH domain